jgi:RimJ/RimL family protein N-acetyltransferase
MSDETTSNQRTPIDTSTNIWQGKRVRLRAIEPGDWVTYFAWDRDEDQSRNLYFVPFPRSEEATRRWAEAESTRPQEGDNFRFVIENEAGEAVGDLTMHDCDPRVGTLSYGISVRKDHRGKGYAAEAIWLVLRYYFEERRYQKVTVGVYSFNEASIRLHDKLGFQREGCLRRMVYTRGQYFDLIYFGLTAEEFAARSGRA